eukprot:gb/GEZN01015275.1/.p1 GENE.gb/GEZN01015275.1/~~gb/GEZN01015275.1/.p1  ORF type:complete len:281 (+),score=40.40 gb/GEZN01015275.1/:129-845(+)
MGVEAKRVSFRAEIACGVCQVLIEEMLEGIKDTSESHHVQTRFRMDEKQKRPYAWSEFNLMEVAESVEKSLQKYGVWSRPKGANGSPKSLRHRDDGAEINEKSTNDISRTYAYLIDKYLEVAVKAFHDDIERDVNFYKDTVCARSMGVCILEEFHRMIPPPSATPSPSTETEATGAAADASAGGSEANDQTAPPPSTDTTIASAEASEAAPPSEAQANNQAPQDAATTEAGQPVKTEL